MTYSENARMTANVRRMGRTAATVVLAGVLAAGILGAYLFVLKKSGLDKAIQDGTALLEQISAQGLDSYLGRAPRRQYYILKEDGRVTGFAAVVLEPELDDDGKLFYLGRHLVYKSGESEISEGDSAFRVSNDLKTFDSRSETTGGMLEQFIYKDGELQGWLRDFRGRKLKLDISHHKPGPLVCPGLEDVISSIGLEGNYSHGVAFEMPFIMPEERRTHVNYQKCWLQPSDRVSPIDTLNQDGRGAKAQWYILDRPINSQELYYSVNHELLWQQDGVEPVHVREAVTREELITQQPAAEEILRHWFDREQDEPDKRNISGPKGDYL